jgi:hypothetical protein
MTAAFPFLRRPAQAALALPLVAGLLGAAPDPAATAEPRVPLLTPTQATPGAAEIRLQPLPGCAAGADCVVAVTTDVRPVAGDRRRLALVLEWPSHLSPPRGEGGWRCRRLARGEAVCFAGADDVAAHTGGRLVLRPAFGAGKPEPRLCPKPAAAYAAPSSALVPDPAAVRLLQAVLADERGLSGTAPADAAVVPDGVVAGETRQGLVARARAAGVPTEPDGTMIAALIGSEINRLVGPAPGCVGLVVAPPPVALPAVPPPATAARPRPPVPAGGAGPTQGVGSATGAGQPPGPAQVLAPPPSSQPPARSPEAFPTSPEEILTWKPWRAVRPPLQGLRRLFGG